MHYNKDFNMECRIARFHNIYGPHGTWKGGREKAPAAFCRKVCDVPRLQRSRCSSGMQQVPLGAIKGARLQQMLWLRHCECMLDWLHCFCWPMHCVCCVLLPRQYTIC
jgi:hypothetical protein